MYVVGDAELLLYWVAVVSFFPLLAFVRGYSAENRFYSKLKKTVLVPSTRLGWRVLWFLAYTLQTVAVYRVRTYGEWVAGINRLALILFIVLQVLLALSHFLFYGVHALNLAVALYFFCFVIGSIDAYYHTLVDTPAGVLMIVVAVFLLYAFVGNLSIWLASKGDAIARDIVANELSPNTCKETLRTPRRSSRKLRH